MTFAPRPRVQAARNIHGAPPPINLQAPESQFVPGWAAKLAYAVVCVAWGTTYYGIRVAVETIPPFVMGASRFLLAGGLLLLVLLARGVKLPNARDAAIVAAPGLLMLTVSNGLINWSELHLASSIVAVLVIMSPFALVGISSFLGEAIPKSTWAGLVISFVGVVALFWPDLRRALESGPAAESSGPPTWLLVGAVLLAASVWSAGSVLSARHKVDCHVGMRIALQMLAGGAGQLAIALALGEPARMGTPSMQSVLATLYLVVVGSWLGYGCYIYILRVFRPDAVSLVTYVNTVVAVLVGWGLGGEAITFATLLGSAIIIAGIAVVNAGLRRAKQ